LHNYIHTYIHMRKAQKSVTLNRQSFEKTVGDLSKKSNNLLNPNGKLIKELTPQQIVAFAIEADKTLSALMRAMKCVKKTTNKETGGLFKTQLGVVTTKMEKTKINVVQMKRIVKAQMKRIKNIKAITPFISQYIK